MTHIVKRYNNTLSAVPSKNNITVNDNTTNRTSTTLGLTGKYSTEYPQTIAENFLWRLGHFTSDLPPSGALPGQLWYRPTGDPLTEDFYIWQGNDQSQGGHSSLTSDGQVPSEWEPLRLGLEKQINDHAIRIDNPHNTTKADIGLGNVNNVVPYDRTLDFKDVLNIVAARNNLNVYPTTDIYTQIEMDARYYQRHAVVDNALKFGGLDPEDFIWVAAPKTNRYIDTNNSISPVVLTVDNNTSSIVSGGNIGDLDILCGVNDSDKHTSTGGGVRVSLNTKSTDASMNVSLYRTNVVNGPAKLRSSLTYDATGLYISEYNSSGVLIDTHDIYHRNNKPTYTEVGALSKTGKAVDSLQLDNMAPAAGSTGSTIVKRNSNGDVYGNRLGLYTTTQKTLSNSSKILYRDVAIDSAVRNMTKTDFIESIGLDGIPAAKGWIAFNGSSGGTYSSRNAVVTKLGTGKYRVTMTSPPPDTKYTVVIGSMDSGAVNTSYGSKDYRVSHYRGWYTISNSSQFVIYVKRTYNDYDVPWRAEKFSSIYANYNYIAASILY